MWPFDLSLPLTPKLAVMRHAAATLSDVVGCARPREEPMRRRKFIVLLGGAAAWPVAARAQAKRIPRVGVLMGLVESDATDQSHLTAFRDALAKLGWTDGRNIRIEVRWGGGDPALYARGAAELVALNAEVLVSEGTPATEALHQQTRTIPIVFIAATDPMGQGFVARLAP